MDSKIFAEWLHRQGRRVLQTESSYWVEVSPRIFQSFPYHHIISPSSLELNNLLKKHAAIGLRYSTDWDAPIGIASYHVIFTRREYSIMSLPKKARYDVQCGMAAASIEPISFSRLGSEGWLLRTDTLKRQSRVGTETLRWWQNLCKSAEGLSGFEAWAAIVNGQLAASLIAFTCDDCCSILYQQSRTEYLKLGVNNALTFVFTSEILRRPEQQWIFYGLHSLDAPPSVDEFKFRMGYAAKQVRQRVFFHPAIDPVINAASYNMMQQISRWLPHNPTITKAEGMFRFYLEGQRPLSQQTWPECLIEHKD